MILDQCCLKMFDWVGLAISCSGVKLECFFSFVCLLCALLFYSSLVCTLFASFWFEGPNQSEKKGHSDLVRVRCLFGSGQLRVKFVWIRYGFSLGSGLDSGSGSNLFQINHVRVGYGFSSGEV